MEPAAAATLTVTGALFALAAAWIALAQLAGRLRGRRIWTTYAVEFATVAAVFVPAWLSPHALAVTFTAVGLACAWEAARAMRLAGGAPQLGLVLASLPLLVVTVSLAGLPRALGLFVLFGLCVLAGSVVTQGGMASAGGTLLLLLYPGLCVAHLVALGSGSRGFGSVVLAYALVEVNDSAAYLVGASVGRRRIFPATSPNKTLEGCLGGLVATLAVAPAFRFAVPDLGTPALLGAAALIALGGLAGDLFASRLKRAAGLKDFAGWVPSHGGVLDVYDSLLFVAPLVHAYLALVRGT